MRFESIETAAAAIASGHRVYVHGAAATPHALIDAMVARTPELSGVEVVHMHTHGPAPYAQPGMEGHFRHNALFIGANVRAAVQAGRADYTPVFLSEIPRLFAPAGKLPLDVALIHVTPHDWRGNCSLGVSVDCALAAALHAKTVVAQVNRRMPRTRGHVLPRSYIDIAVEVDEEIEETIPAPLDEVALAIGGHVAALIPDGATLQLGIGAIPNAVLASLADHRDLGIHTEMFTDGVLDLVEAGVITGRRKTIHQGKIISAFVMGSRRLYAFIDRNSAVELRPVDYTNSIDVIAAHDRLVAVNSALAVDLTGQVMADSIGPRLYSGIGGQIDFIRGAARSKGGVPVIVLPSTAMRGTVSRICAQLPLGAGVVTTRGDVHWVVTEYGARNLHGKTVRERASMLIEIAHPGFRAALEEEAIHLGYLSRGLRAPPPVPAPRK